MRALTRESLHSQDIRRTNRPSCACGHLRQTASSLISLEDCGAANRTRTCDPVITNDVLYQLSYCGGPNAASGLSRKRPHLISGTVPVGKKNAAVQNLVAAPA